MPENRPLPAGSTIGILGGGQLGRMLAMAAARLGYKTVIFDPDPDAPAAQTANRHIIAGFAEPAALAAFASACHVITYEFENIPVETIAALARNTRLFPPVAALENTQDRLAEKRFLNRIGLATAPYADIATRAQLDAGLKANAGCGILKTRRFGYDGKGQQRIANAAQADAAWRELAGKPLILEGLVDFSAELSVIAVRAPDGQFCAYDPPTNHHSGGILRSSTVPSPVDGEMLAKAVAIARHIAVALDYVGVIGVELFLGRNGELLVNEIAPRVHNSGHWTEAACAVSQFEQHIRAICGLALGQTTRHSDCMMENLIGKDISKVPALLQQANGLLHLYGKHQVRAGRKMGHVTRLFPRTESGETRPVIAVDKEG